jgi:hypothetical protein
MSVITHAKPLSSQRYVKSLYIYNLSGFASLREKYFISVFPGMGKEEVK